MPIRAFSTSSLATRLFFASAILLPLLLWFSGAMLNHAFKRNLQLSKGEQLTALMYILLGAAEPGEEGLEMPLVLDDPRFGVANSGLYGWVLNEHGEIKWRSQSMELISQRIMPSLTHEFEAGRKKFIEVEFGGEGYYAIYLDTVWDRGDTEKGYRFVVAHSERAIDLALSRYRHRLFKWLGGLAVLLIIVQSLIARWGLLPLRHLATELKRVEDGSSVQLEGDYPADIRPVTQNLNAVLRIEREQRERYKNNLSDLAHSLKTPLSVVRGELERKTESVDSEQLASLIEEQVERMTSIIDHQLRRASAQVTHAVHHTPVNIKEMIERIVRALTKVYRHKQIEFELNIDSRLNLLAEEADMMELLGNLIENACKYGQSAVTVSVKRDKNDVVINVADDGPGVPNDVRKSILLRGARADTAKSGQGLGLALAVDILSGYGGGLEIGGSSMGGANFKLRLPL